MEKQKRKQKQVPGKGAGKGVCGAPGAMPKTSREANMLQGSVYGTCPHCAGVGFKDILGSTYERWLCPGCELKKSAYLIDRYAAEDALNRVRKYLEREIEISMMK